MTAAIHDELEHHDRVYLEKLRLAADCIIQLGEDRMIPDTLETELHIFKDRVDRALLLPEAAAEIFPWHEAPPSGTP